jgi:mannosidase alpha-like ER degradation enhancer 2
MCCLLVSAALGCAAPHTAPQPRSARPLDRSGLAAQVREELRRSWAAYARDAWGHDELKPASRQPHDWHAQSLLITPVDSLDTLLLLGLTSEADAAHRLIVERLSFDHDIEVKNFEITIRVLGGLLSGYQMTGDEKLLRLAEDLGNRLLPVFDSPTDMPYMYVNLKTGKTRGAKSNPAEIGTLMLEFGALGKLTGRGEFYDKAKRAVVAMYDRRSPLGLVGEEIDVESGEWTSPQSHVGGGIDSYYEYLLKSARLFGDPDFERLWRTQRAALDRYLADEAPTGLWYGQVDMRTGERTAREFGALHAFLPAVFALAGDAPRAARLQASCQKMWRLAGIEPEVIDYTTMKILRPAYPLRPEIIESAYYLRRMTGDPAYLAMGREYLEGLRAHCRAGDGYTTLKSVVTMEQGDLMPSYFLAETLKYLYLIFAPDGALDLDRVVLTTEAHPLRRTW